MCDYCGCRRQRPIDELSAEHDRLLNLVYQLRSSARTGDHGEVAHLLRVEVEPLLREHTTKEEAGLFTELRRSWVAGNRLRSLSDEHRDIERQLVRVLQGGPDWPRLVARLADTLTAHIFDEETDLFPYALYELDPAQWAAVEAVHDAISTRAA